MSRLGGNSPSADTDKSNNLQGADGKVQAVVAGTNITSIDNTDPANPIINAATQSTPSPTTTKGDVIARGASVDERVAVGTDGQVMTADAASASGVKWVTPAAGGAGAGAISTSHASRLALTYSGSSYASKGTTYDVPNNIKVLTVRMPVNTAAANTYKMVIAEVSGATDVIDAITATSDNVTVATTNVTPDVVFTFGAGVSLVAGKAYAFILVRTDSTSTAANPASFPAAVGTSDGFLEYRASVRYASNDPLVSDVTRFATNSTIHMDITYEVVI